MEIDLSSIYKVISTRAEAFRAWDKRAVIVREDRGYYFIYPLIGRGYQYPNFDLKRECCLGTFVSKTKAYEWAQDKGYEYTLLRS